MSAILPWVHQAYGRPPPQRAARVLRGPIACATTSAPARATAAPAALARRITHRFLAVQRLATWRQLFVWPGGLGRCLPSRA